MRVTDAVGYHEPRDSVSQDWIRTLDAWGMLPVLIPNHPATAEKLFDIHQPDCLILSGGEDIGSNAERDETEIRLLTLAIERQRPVFGVCRGMQLINRHFGGRLGTVEGHVATPHDINVARDWQPFYGERTHVNSYHNICVPADGLGTGLLGQATDDAGNIEGLAHAELPIRAVMWHPERTGAAGGDRKLLESIL